MSDEKSVKSCVIYLNKICLAASQTVPTARIALIICKGQHPTMCSQCSRFNLNRFTFGRVIAKRVNTVFCPVDYFHESPDAMLCIKRIISIVSTSTACTKQQTVFEIIAFCIGTYKLTHRLSMAVSAYYAERVQQKAQCNGLAPARLSVRPSMPSFFLALTERAAHSQRDSPGGSMRRGQRTSEYYEDGHTC